MKEYANGGIAQHKSSTLATDYAVPGILSSVHLDVSRLGSQS